jgi:hypothetical protein
MKRGLVIAGAILTDAGEPIARARVTIDHYFEKPESNTHTDANGQFRFANARAKETTLTVQADGFAPEDRAVQVAADLTEQRFSLSRGVLLRARVVDEAGQGVPGAIVRVSPDSLNRPIFDWMANTDVGGHFEWAHAPRSPQKYSVCADGFESQSKFPLSSDADEQVITLKKSSPRQRLRVVANVVDAETKRPVDSFDVLVSETRDEPFRTSLGNFRPNGTGTSGRGTFAVSSFAPRFAAEVRSDGYWPARATNVNSGQGELTLNFELRRALPIRGVVQLSDGAPVAGALVILCTGRDAAEMTSAAKLQLPRSGNATHTQTDADGRFTLPKRLEMRAIVVAHELGFAEVAPPQLENSEKIELLPWGRIEGVFHIGSELGANETMQLQNLAWRPGNQAVVFHREAKTDSAGHFVLEGVPPGEHRVQYRPKIRSSTIPASHGLPIVVRAGETSYVQVGGTGRMVIGRVVTDGIVEPIDWLREVHTLSLKVATPVEAAWPSKEEFSSDADFDRAVETYFERTRGFWLSDAGKALDRARRHYVLIFGEDGSFRINDVPPGIYQLSISPTKRRNANSPSVSQSPFGEPLASVSVEVTVPESEKEPVNEVIDVGTLVLKPAGR